MCVPIAQSVQLARAGDALADAELLPIRCRVCYDDVHPIDWAAQRALDAIRHVEHVAFDPRPRDARRMIARWRSSSGGWRRCTAGTTR
jgi:hypothetical protein